MVRTQAQFRSMATPQQQSPAPRKPSKSSTCSSSSNSSMPAHRHASNGARHHQQRSPQRTNHRMAESVQRGARDLRQDMETKEYQEVLLDYPASSGEGGRRGSLGSSRLQRSVREADEVDVTRFYRKQCDRLVSSVEGLQSWRATSGSKEVAAASGHSTTIPLQRVHAHESESETSCYGGLEEERVRRYRK